MADFDFFTISELTNAYRSRHLSPVEVIESAYARATRLQPELNIFAFLGARESLLEQARLSEARWRSGSSLGELDGVPMTVKDTILVAGWPTLRGSMTVDPQQGWGEDSPAVARLREQGVIFLGKTNTPEFGWTGVTQSPLCGVSRNPWNRSLTPGGSSGGSAAAVAVGIGHASLGTDAGGSLRIPASFCGVVAFKPTAGLVAYYPPSPAGTLGHVGPITRSVSDAATMLNIIGVPDVRDWPAMPRKGIDYRSETESGLKGCRIAWSPRLGFAKVDPVVLRVVERAVSLFSDMGAHVEEIAAPLPDPTEIFRILFTSGLQALLDKLAPEKRDLVDPDLKKYLERSDPVSLAQYLDALDRRVHLGCSMQQFHQTYDLLLTPSTAVPPFEAGIFFPQGYSDWLEWTPFTYPFNLTGQPAMSVPCGIAEGDRPVGLQIVGGLHQDALVLRAARTYEAMRLERTVNGARVRDV